MKIIVLLIVILAGIGFFTSCYTKNDSQYDKKDNYNKKNEKLEGFSPTQTEEEKNNPESEMENTFERIDLENDNRDQQEIFEKNQQQQLPTHTEEEIQEDEDFDPKKKYGEKYMKKFKTRDSAEEGKFAYHNYVDSKHKSKNSTLDKFFTDGSLLKDKDENYKFGDKIGSTNNDTDIQFASYSPGSRGKVPDRDKFNSQKLLPKDMKNDWFDDVYENTSIKNTHLINIYKPIGVNTIQTTLKNASHDLRGCPTNPKYVVAPWLNSSYEPDTNLINQSLCY